MTNTSPLQRRCLRLTPSHLLLMCAIVGLMAGGAILWMLGFGPWAVVALSFLIACPFVVAWALMIEREGNRASRKSS